MKRVLTDRFWQAGISAESKDEFYARLGNTRATFDGFASTVRGTIRQIREAGYAILYATSRLGDQFYSLADLPGPLADALFTNSHALSAHHYGVLLGTVGLLIDRCPAKLRAQFLPPLLILFFERTRYKLLSEWTAVIERTTNSEAQEDLTEEMKAESILRQVTYSSLSIACSLIYRKRAFLLMR